MLRGIGADEPGGRNGHRPLRRLALLTALGALLIAMVGVALAITSGRDAARRGAQSTTALISTRSLGPSQFLLLEDDSDFEPGQGDTGCYTRVHARAVGLNGRPDFNFGEGTYVPDPTGTRVAFRAGNSLAAVADLRSGRIRKLPPYALGAAPVTWSRDGHALLTGRLLLNGNRIVRLSAEAGSLAPDGRAVVGGRGDGITLATAANHWRTQRVLTERNITPTGSEWSPDADIAAVAYSEDDKSADRTAVRIIDRRRPHQSAVVKIVGRFVSMVWSPDGRQLALLTDYRHRDTRIVTVMDRDGGGVHQVLSAKSIPPLQEMIAADVRWLSWRAPGELSVSESRPGEGRRIELLDAEDGTIRWSASGLPEAWSPDGRWLLAVSAAPYSRHAHWLIVDVAHATTHALLAGGKPVRVPPAPSATPKALWLKNRAAVITSPGGVYAVNPAAATARRIVVKHGDQDLTPLGMIHPTTAGKRLLRQPLAGARTASC
jgi:hypothetical protein